MSEQVQVVPRGALTREIDSPESLPETGHRSWCSPEHCFVTDDRVQVHSGARIAGEDSAAEVRWESRLFDPEDDSNVYLELHLECLRIRWNAFSWSVPLTAVRRLRDQLTEHLDAAERHRGGVTRPGATG